MSDRAHTRHPQKCFCGRELRTAQERTYGECHRCQTANEEEDAREIERLDQTLLHQER